jgi:hypothetical protein
VNQGTRLSLAVASGACVLLGAIYLAYAKYGGVVARSDSAPEKGTGIFYRVIVRRIPFTIAGEASGEGAVYEATLLFRDDRRMASHAFRPGWSAPRIDIVGVEWTGPHEFRIRFGTDERAILCRFEPWRSAEWREEKLFP